MFLQGAYSTCAYVFQTNKQIKQLRTIVTITRALTALLAKIIPLN